MKLALNGATTLLGTIEQDIEAAVAAGYDGLELWLPKVNAYLERGDLGALRQQLADSGLRLLTINSLERFNFNDPSGHQRMLVDAERLCRLAQALGVETVVVVPSPRPAGLTDEAVMAESERSMRDLLALAERYDVKLALEFLGFEGCSIRTLDEALQVVRRIGHPRLSVVVDTFHFYVGRSRVESLATLRSGELCILHINDCEPGPLAAMSDDRRLYPGLGAIPLQAIRAALGASGYDGFISIEIFRPEYWHQPVASVAAAALMHAKRFA
ncbi:MAG TPA: sugar phosphate isomerase/epimerase [Symbiobacteriaceae bacterium]|nr:sugar phosphate isomerase/epimerase [Symbiobacteriaceae bacterium]